MRYIMYLQKRIRSQYVYDKVSLTSFGLNSSPSTGHFKELVLQRTENESIVIA